MNSFMNEHDEYDIIYLLIIKARESVNSAFDNLLDTYKEALSTSSIGKRYSSIGVLRSHRRKIHVMRTNLRTIFNFVFKTFTAFYKHDSLRLIKYQKIEEVLDKAEAEMWARLKVKTQKREKK